MKKSLTVTILLAAALCGCSTHAGPSHEGEILLSEGWRLSRSGGAESCKATVPSTVAGALEAAGYYGDSLFEGRNYASADRSIFDDTWIWKTGFKASPSKGRRYSLVFDGIGYYADIFLNGSRIASSDTTFGVFLKREYDVTSLLRRNNSLEVRVRRAREGDLNHGYVDWNPRPLDESMGIVRPVRLRASGDVTVEDVFVIPRLNTETLAEADLEVRVTLRNRSSQPAEGTLSLDLQGSGRCSLPFSLEAGGTSTLTLTPVQAPILHLDNPRVWWTYDLGSPEMYRIVADVELDGTLSDRRETDFGVRSITSRLTPEGWRQFTLNGRDILLRGGGWTDDIFMRDTPGNLARQVAYVMDMNLNCIRFENIWGKDDTVYDLCDSLGVLALVGWSCQWEWESYCGLPETPGYGCINDPASEDLAVAYFRDQVVRLHNHPALIGWMTGSDRIPNPRLEERYMQIYSAQEYRPYICSAKSLTSTVSGLSGSKMAGPYEYVAPDYWYRDTHNGGAFGFNTETGIGANLPQEESLRRMIPEDELWPLSAAWDYHCTASTTDMNTPRMLAEVIEGQYGAASTFEDFVRRAHAVDYDGTRAMFEAFRVRIPHTTGIVQWMLNSAWPSLYWQLYDSYGVPTAGYYGTKKACAPVQLIFNHADRKVYVVSESPDPAELVARVQVFDAASKPLGEESRSVSVGYRTVAPVFDLRRHDGRPHFVSLTLSLPDGTPVADNFYCLAASENVYAWDETNWYVTPIKRYGDLSFVFGGEKADVQMEVRKSTGSYSVTLTNESSVIAPMNILKAKDSGGALVVPAFWSDNFFALLPGETRTVSCRTPATDVHIELD